MAPNASMDSVLHDLYIRFKRWCSRHKISCSIQKFTLDSIGKTVNRNWPLYKCKASKAPRLIAWLCELCIAYAAIAPPIAKERADYTAACVWGMAEYFYLTRLSVIRFNDDQKASMALAMDMFLFFYSCLAREAGANQRYMWNIVPKFHAWQHICLDAISSGENPSTFHCFGPEDGVGKTIKIACKSHPFTACSSTLEKYRPKLWRAWKKLEEAFKLAQRMAQTENGSD